MITADELNQIVTLSESVPAEYRLKCFELLLADWLEKGKTASLSSPEIPSQGVENLIFPVDVNAFLSQYRLKKEEIAQLFHLQEGRIVPLYQLESKTKSKAEIEHALLLALENAMTTGQFQVDVEMLRRRCQEDRCYDIANFMRHLRRNANLFKSVSPRIPLALSPEGKTALAELVHGLQRK